MPTDIDIVIFNEGNAATETRIQSKVSDLLNESFARFVFRVSLTGVDQLNGRSESARIDLIRSMLLKIKFARL